MLLKPCDKKAKDVYPFYAQPFLRLTLILAPMTPSSVRTFSSTVPTWEIVCVAVVYGLASSRSTTNTSIDSIFVIGPPGTSLGTSAARGWI